MLIAHHLSHTVHTLCLKRPILSQSALTGQSAYSFVIGLLLGGGNVRALTQGLPDQM